MKKICFALALISINSSAFAFGEFGQWSAGWGQGTSEYQATVNDKNKLYIACPDTYGDEDDKPVTMTLTVNGRDYGSYSNKGFDLIINNDGVRIQTPYETGYRAGHSNFEYMWKKLRTAKSIVAITHDGKKLALPTKNAAKALPALHSKNYACKTEWDIM